MSNRLSSWPDRIAMRPNRHSIFVPSSLKLTPMVLVGALRKLPTTDIRDAVELLIEELDVRDGDCDLELEPFEDNE
jgi:hypothetical protein